MSRISIPRAFLAWWFVAAYFLSATLSVLIYVTNPDSTSDQSVDALVLRASVVLMLLPLSIGLLISSRQVPRLLYQLNRALPLLKFIPLVAFFTMVTGLFMGNLFGFVIGDTYKLLSLPLGLMFGMTLPLLPLSQAFLNMSVLNAILFIAGTLPARFSGDLLVSGIGTFHLLAPLCAVPMTTSGASRISLIMTSMVAVALGLKRSTLLVFFFLIGFLGMKDRRMRTLVVVLALVTGGTLTYYGDEVSAFNDLYDRIGTTYEDGRLDTSSGSRIQEVRSSWSHMATTAVLGPVQILLLGMGSGATYPLDSDELRLNTISESSTEVHNIHFTPMTLVFRHGVLTALLVLAAYGSCLLYCYQSWMKGGSHEMREISKFIFLFGLVLGTVSLSGFTIVGDLMFPVLVGALIRAKHSHDGAVDGSPRSSQDGVY